MPDDHRDHITVCMCTYKRPALLARVLGCLAAQETEALFTYSLVVVDNDNGMSASPVVKAFREQAPATEVQYHCEPQKNIAQARNRGVLAARGEFVALIDDDEYPDRDWLLRLYQACRKHRADGALGPVAPSFETGPPKWILKGRFYHKGDHETGTVLRPFQTRTSNVLMRSTVYESPAQLFNPAFRRGGEDIDFFMRAIARGRVFVFCREAPVHETIGPERCTRRFMMRRALQRGQVSTHYTGFGPAQIVTSLAAVPIYAAVLPVATLAGQHHMMKVAVRLVEHCGRLLAVCGLDLSEPDYVME